MRKLLTIIGIGAAVAVSASAAMADGMPSRGRSFAAAPTCAHFGGIYAGVHGAWNYQKSALNDHDGFLTDNAGYNVADSSVGGGAQIGYNFQTRGKCTVWGVEADFSWGRTDGNILQSNGGFDAHSAQSAIDWVATLRTRGGIVVDNVMLYLTGGVAFADITQRFTHAHTPIGGAYSETASFSDRQIGFVAGAGIEYALTSHISVKSEVLYMNFGDWKGTYAANPAHFGPAPNNQFSFSGSDELWSSRIGLNVRF